MALEMLERCERCKGVLRAQDSSARICSYECTFCVSFSNAMQDTGPTAAVNSSRALAVRRHLLPTEVRVVVG